MRLPGWDYAANGTYFITLCTQNRECLFGDIQNGKMRLNDFGTIVLNEWFRTREIRREIELYVFVVMPIHIHGVVIINPADSNVGAHGHAPLQLSPKSLGSFIIGFKSITAKRINTSREMPGVPIWQRNYHEHIVRNDDELNRIRQYILNNPQKWKSDFENPGETYISPK